MSHLARMQTYPFFTKTRAGKCYDYSTVFGKLRFQNVLYPHYNAKLAFSNSSDLKNVFEMLGFDDGLVRTEGLNGETKLRFQIAALAQYSPKCAVHDVNIWLLRDSVKNKNIVFVVTAEYLEF